MRQETYWHRVIWRLAIALIMSVSFWLISPLSAAAQSLEDYFQISYDPVSFNKNEINGSEVFYAAIRGRATCIKDFPLPVSEVSITSRIVAEHAVSGARVALNSSYTVIIKPFPSKEGDTTEINQDVRLQFSDQAESGDYDIIGELIEAKVKVEAKVEFAWLDATRYLPQTQLVGSVKYIAPEPTTSPTTTPVPPATPVPIPAPTPVPPTTAVPVPAPTPAPLEYSIAWWVWLIVALSAATTIVNVILFLRYRTR